MAVHSNSDNEMIVWPICALVVSWVYLTFTDSIPSAGRSHSLAAAPPLELTVLAFLRPSRFVSILVVLVFVVLALRGGSCLEYSFHHHLRPVRRLASAICFAIFSCRTSGAEGDTKVSPTNERTARLLLSQRIIPGLIYSFLGSLEFVAIVTGNAKYWLLIVRPK